MVNGLVRNVRSLFLCLFVLLLSACGVNLQHVPSSRLDNVDVHKKASIMIADIGDVRVGESPDRIGQGASYWFPVSYYARDSQGKILPASYFLSESLSKDLAALGYEATFVNDPKTKADVVK